MAAINGYSDVVSSGVQTLITGGIYSDPTLWYVGLYTGTVFSDGSIGLDTEVEFNPAPDNNYARLQINAVGGASPAWSVPESAPNSFKVSNGSQAEYPVASEDWGTITFAVVMKSAQNQLAADMIFGGALSTSKAIGVGTTAVFLTGALSVTTSNN